MKGVAHGARPSHIEGMERARRSPVIGRPSSISEGEGMKVVTDTYSIKKSLKFSINVLVALTITLVAHQPVVGGWPDELFTLHRGSKRQRGKRIQRKNGKP
ncbi:MAG: hypothetical protein D6723_03820 [Acidobacteria bacterium]|nr:MAG: hypothetical protein D6723_03820 [Acidobacteriota bacterium]